eukprot:COSAG01_NODE_6845_length_3472_cov_1.489772_5_plen_30_part_01
MCVSEGDRCDVCVCDTCWLMVRARAVNKLV